VSAILLSPDATQPDRSVSSPFPTWSCFFAAILLYVCAVSVYDGYLVLRTGDMIRDFEMNPIGLLLIDCNGGNPALFLIAKTVGTLLVVGLLSALNRRSQRLARPVAFTLALFQSGLLIFLQNC
jgi:hypothetical protein